jgi:hypothetical protein
MKISSDSANVEMLTTDNNDLSSSPQSLNNTANNNNTNPLKWSTKERLFLVSSVLINGDCNWSFVSEQLKQWMKMTTSYSKPVPQLLSNSGDDTQVDIEPTSPVISRSSSVIISKKYSILISILTFFSLKMD